jgi:hypothetical protein
MGWGQSHSLSKYEWGVLSPGVDRPRFEADHSPPPSVKLKNEWSYTFIYTYALRCHAEDFGFICNINPLNAELNPICYSLVLLKDLTFMGSCIVSIFQQDATLHSFFICGNCSTCFGWYFHPSSGAQTNGQFLLLRLYTVVLNFRIEIGSYSTIGCVTCTAQQTLFRWSNHVCMWDVWKTEKWDGEDWSGSAQKHVAGTCKYGNKTFRLADLLASQERLSSIELNN